MKFADVDEPDDPFRGPWFDSRTAAAYVPCRSVKAWYEWRKRHRIVARSNGSVMKADIDRALRMKRIKRSGRHPNSLANLAKRRIAS